MSILHKLYAAWMAFGRGLGWIVSHAVLTVVYFAVVTPIALIGRLCGHDPLRLRLDPDADSYWIERDPSALASERCEKQF